MAQTPLNLTGLRWIFHEESDFTTFATQISGAIRYKFSVWVIVADLDKFKFLIDTYGHAAGDAVLR